MIFPDKSRFNIDAALRYYPVVKIIDNLKVEGTVLEVGSGTNGISDYYTGKVIGVDSDFAKTKTKKNPNIRHIKASLDKLPFKKESFQIIVCLDTFEHIPGKKRSTAIKEFFRVLKKNGILFLGFPRGELAKWAERIILDRYKIVTKKEHPWLSEHKKYGLPDDKRIYDYVGNLRTKKIKIIKNTNILVWLFIHFFFTIYPSSKISRILNLFISPIFKISTVNIPPFYRYIYLIKKYDKKN